MSAPSSEPVAAGSRVGVLVPVKAFGEAKRRLAAALDPVARADLSLRLATGVVRAARPLPVWIVCDDTAVAAWAGEVGAEVVWEPGRGLNGAVEAGVAHLTALGCGLVVIAHGDLARPAGLLPALGLDPSAVASATGTDPSTRRVQVLLVPDRLEDGTNVAVVPTGRGFRFSYGPGSFDRHLVEATRCGLEVVVIRDADLALDVDLPEHLVSLDHPGAAP